MTNIVNTVVELSGAPGTTDSDGTDFDLLRDAVLTAGLDGALSDEAANLTVFAPTDDAFIGLAQTLGFGGADEAGALGYIVDALTLLGGGDPIPLLQDVLTYHVVGSGRFDKAAVVALGDGAMIETLQGANVTLDLSAPGLVDLDPGLPDPNLIGFDVEAGNGIIHVLDGVLLPVPVSAILSQPETDFLIGDGGGDYFSTRDGDDFIDGNGGRDIIRAGAGDDVAIGGEGSDWIAGGRGSDVLLGEAGHDRIFGGRGDDVITGGAGNDWMISGHGNDTFVFENGSDADKIIGFRDGKDLIDLSGYDGIDDFSDIEAKISNRGFSTKIDLVDGDSIYLLGLQVLQLDEGDFIFS